jgi:hypothetical protein
MLKIRVLASLLLTALFAGYLVADQPAARRVVKLGQRSEVAVPLTTNYDKEAGFRPGGTDPDKRKARVDLDVYSNAATDYRTYAPGQPGWSSVEQTAAELEKVGSSLRLVARAEDLKADAGTALQVLCNEVIGPPRTPMLASFILPPRWKPDGHYPIVLTGNGYTISNNRRLFRESGPTDVFVLAGKAAGAGRSGVLVVTVNCGGTEASGIQPSAVANIGRVLDRAAELGGDRHRVVFWGGSRGGLTALVWGANPLDLDYTPLALFARVPFPTLADTPMTPLSLVPQATDAYRAVFGPDGWRYRERPDIGAPDRSELCRRITGFADRAAANAHSGMGYVDRLAAAHRAGKLRFVVTSYGTKDPWELYAPGVLYHHAMEQHGVPVTTHVGLGAGHEGAPDQLEKDLLHFVQDLGRKKPEGWAPAPGLFYAVQQDRGSRGRLHWVKPPSTPFSARVPFREQAGRQGMIELVGAAGGEYTVTLAQGGKVVKSWSGKFDASETFTDRFVIPAEGLYDWSFTWKGHPVTRTPTLTADGKEPPLTLTATREQPGLEDYFVNPKRPRAFGVDEVDSDWPTP